MITVANIKRLREFRETKPKATLLIMGSKDLKDSERIEVGRILGSAMLIGYEEWVKTRGTHPFFMAPTVNTIYVNAEKNGKYDSQELFEAVISIFNTDVNNRWITQEDMIMVGLPGRTPQERERARADLTRWFGDHNATNKLAILCDESD